MLKLYAIQILFFLPFGVIMRKLLLSIIQWLLLEASTYAMAAMIIKIIQSKTIPYKNFQEFNTVMQE